MIRRLPMKHGIAIAALCIANLVASVAAQSYPDKPIRIVVPFSPGGGTDILARQLAEALTQSEKWNVVVENRPGGTGAIALNAIANAPADGYQIVLALRENIVIAPLMARQAGEAIAFDPLKDFTPIVHLTDAPMVLVVNPQSAQDSMVKVLATGKAKPGELRFATSGYGTVSHLLLAMLNRVAGTVMTHVTYKGSNPALTDLVGGHVDMVGGSIASAKSFIESGRVRPVAVSSRERVFALPDVPTIAELGYPGFDVGTWYGLFGPADMAQDVVHKINVATNKVLESSRLHRTLLDQGMQTRIGTADAFAQAFRADYAGLAEQLPGLNMANQ